MTISFDDIDHDRRRDFVERLAQLRVARVALEIDLLAALPEHRDLALLEVGLREDFAVHLHENLLEDLGCAGRPRKSPEARDDADAF